MRRLIYPSPDFVNECKTAIAAREAFEIIVARRSRKLHAVRIAVEELQNRRTRWQNICSVFAKLRTLDFWTGTAGASVDGWRYDYSLSDDLLVRISPPFQPNR